MVQQFIRLGAGHQAGRGQRAAVVVYPGRKLGHGQVQAVECSGGAVDDALAHSLQRNTERRRRVVTTIQQRRGERANGLDAIQHGWNFGQGSRGGVVAELAGSGGVEVVQNCAQACGGGGLQRPRRGDAFGGDAGLGVRDEAAHVAEENGSHGVDAEATGRRQCLDGVHDGLHLNGDLLDGVQERDVLVHVLRNEVLHERCEVQGAFGLVDDVLHLLAEAHTGLLQPFQTVHDRAYGHHGRGDGLAHLAGELQDLPSHRLKRRLGGQSERVHLGEERGQR